MNLGECHLRSYFFVRSASRFPLPREPASPASEGLEPFDLREIGGRSRARELRSVPLDFFRCKVEKGVRSASRSFAGYAEQVFC